MPKQTYSIELEERQYRFLEQMVEKYRLIDVNKAVRCMLDYAAATPDQQDSIWAEIRCLDC